MQKVVLKLDIDDNVNSKRKAMKLVSSIAGLESISMDMKDKKLTVTVIGDMDPVSLVEKLRKNYRTEIISVGPTKEPEKPKEDSKKPKEESKNPQSMAQVTDFVHAMQAYNSRNNLYYVDPSYSRYGGYYRSVEEDPNGCTIC